MDHVWIILGPFWTILLIALSTLCQWSCGPVDHFLEVKLMEVNFHFGFFFVLDNMNMTMNSETDQMHLLC